MKKLSLVLGALSILTSSQLVWAGWGAIACTNMNEACTWVDGQPDYQIAVDMALERCNVEHGACSFRRWEHNSCVAERLANGEVVEACN